MRDLGAARAPAEAMPLEEPRHADAETEHDAPDERSGWQQVADDLEGFAPDQIPCLAAARELELVYPLLHALTRGGLRDFLVRVAVLEAVVADPGGGTSFGARGLDGALYWLKDPVRDTVLRTLRTNGWLSYDPDAGYRITDAGRFVATALSFLRARVREGSLLPTVEGIDYMLRLGVDPVRQVLLLRSQLEDLRTDMETARASHSEVILRGAADRLRQTLELSERIRAVLARVPLEMTEARRVVHEIHDLLSRLHGVGSDLHAAITEVGRQYLHLVAGLTTTDIFAVLMGLQLDELAAVGKDALLPVVVAPPLLSSDVLAAEAEAYLSRQREPPGPVAWTEPPEPGVANDELVLPPEAAALLNDLDRLVAEGRPEPLASFVPRRTPGESFLRATLLSLVGEQVGGEGVAGRLGALPLTVIVESKECLLQASSPLSEISDGRVELAPREVAAPASLGDVRGRSPLRQPASEVGDG